MFEYLKIWWKRLLFAFLSLTICRAFFVIYLNAYFNDRRINLLAFKTTDIESAEYLKMKLHEFAIKANNGKYAPVN